MRASARRGAATASPKVERPVASLARHCAERSLCSTLKPAAAAWCAAAEWEEPGARNACGLLHPSGTRECGTVVVVWWLKPRGDGYRG